MRDIRRQRQIALWEVLFLVFGAAAGLGVTKVILDDLSTDNIHLDLGHWIGWVCVAYAVLMGISMAVSAMLVVHRIRTGYRWRAGAMAWFAVGCAGWTYSAAVAGNHLILGTNDGFFLIDYVLELLTCGLHVGGIIFFITCLASGRSVRGWWMARGWWPEWSGLWLLGLISIGGSTALALGIIRGSLL
jgi:hypothetical protein